MVDINKEGVSKIVSEMSAPELHEYLKSQLVCLGTVVDVLNDVAASGWKYEAQEDVAEMVIEKIVGAMLKDVPMSGLTRAATLSGLGFSQNAFD